MKTFSVKVNAVDVSGKGYDVSVYVFGENNTWGDITVAYDRCGDDESMFVYDGHINTSDPGEGPVEEYANRDDALGSEYGWAFEIASFIADKVVEK